MIMEMHRNPSHDYNESITSGMKAWMRETGTSLQTCMEC